MKFLILLIVLASQVGCGYNRHLSSVIADLENTPPCDTTNLFLDSNDTKLTLAGKVIILNSKLDCHSDNTYYTTKKLDSYKKL